RCNISLVEFISHGNRFCDQRINRNAAKLAYCLSKCRSQNISHPAETFYDFLGVCSETEYFSDSFVHGAVRFVSVCHVLYNKHCHVRGCNTAHRSRSEERRVGKEERTVW